ncbi:PhzF family phenazine biosynthesis protein [Bradyrhizobium tropiciagri]|uniref:PhzF family phenazine biosynthesis protein n=1 Tax=Bradyrhizobium tropiciagri TaxID=312253 RepID=UPI001BA55A6A|nr:PhzF family phenazine biosynthesis isomerase [Bradyrhizobium tropiciagri]MBR0870326.1 PhzF family phenazine biosynthesis protein [Bradyrhizobium tropiciagri]
MTAVELVSVFTVDGEGGNPCPIVVDAGSMSASDMQGVARRHGHESGFVLPAESDDFDLTFRFFVPNHEMEMCGHATIGALWLLARQGKLTGDTIRISTRSGPVTGYISRDRGGGIRAEITQPAGKSVPLTAQQRDDVLRALAAGPDSIGEGVPCNAVTSRVKTLVPMRSPDALHALDPAVADVEAVCGRIGSSGLYPFAVIDRAARLFEARQFPRSSGYREDAATGIAAAALAFGLLDYGLVAPSDDEIRILQGRAMGRLSEIRVRIGFAGGRPVGCLLGGNVVLMAAPLR